MEQPTSELAQAIRAHQQGQLEKAAPLYQSALKTNPRDPAPLHFYGLLLTQTNQLKAGIELMQQSIRLSPRSAAYHLNLANALETAGQFDQAIALYQRVIDDLDTTSIPARLNCTHLLDQRGKKDQAIQLFQQCIQLDVNCMDAYANLGALLALSNRNTEAETWLRKGLTQNPHHPATRKNLTKLLSNQLLQLHYTQGDNPEKLFKAHHEWGQLALADNPSLGNDAGSELRPRPGSPTTANPLRIAYISADFSRHVVGRFFQPILAHHDKDKFTIICYSNVAKPDTETKVFQSHAHLWRDISTLSDDQALDLIRKDQIDILIDLSGHSQGNRLPLLAAQPAPVQITYLGYPGTTGLPTIQYRITDNFLDPPEITDAYYTESLLRLPGPFFAYTPPQSAPPLAPPPVLANGYITFAALHNPEKITPQMIAAWNQILAAVPNSRLLLAQSKIPTPPHNLDAARIQYLPRMPYATYLATYNSIDIVLDTYPWTGHTTTCDALWMGVPVITRLGPIGASRLAGDVLSRVGLSDLIAESESDYIQLAKKLATDIPRLIELRSTMRTRMEGSPILDAAALTRSLEAAYLAAWISSQATKRLSDEATKGR